MDFLNQLRARCSVRRYEEREVEQEKIDDLLEAARVAPSACNKQPIKIKVIQGEDLLKLEGVYKTFNAPLAFLICANHEEAWVRAYDQKNSCDIDASIVCDHMMLEAHDLGLDSVWVCAFDPAGIKQAFAIPEHLEPINLLICGYGKEGTRKSSDRHQTERKALEEIIF